MFLNNILLFLIQIHWHTLAFVHYSGKGNLKQYHQVKGENISPESQVVISEPMRDLRIQTISNYFMSSPEVYGNHTELSCSRPKLTQLPYKFPRSKMRTSLGNIGTHHYP